MGDSAARRELYGMLAMRFGDTDVDKDGKINAAEFDGLCEDVASLPRRFGLAPSWEKEHGTVERRTASRKAMFDMLDLRQGPPRGWIGLEQFVNWATDHLITKVATIDVTADVDYYHIEQYGEHQYLSHLEEASPTLRPGRMHLFMSSSWPSSLSATPGQPVCSLLPNLTSSCPAQRRFLAHSAWHPLRPARRLARHSSTA